MLDCQELCCAHNPLILKTFSLCVCVCVCVCVELQLTDNIAENNLKIRGFTFFDPWIIFTEFSVKAKKSLSSKQKRIQIPTGLKLHHQLFIYLLRTFPPHLGSFLCCFFFHYVSAKFPLAFFRWFTATSDRNAESCNRIPSNYCLP